jgi:hypothetical protein
MFVNSNGCPLCHKWPHPIFRLYGVNAVSVCIKYYFDLHSIFVCQSIHLRRHPFMFSCISSHRMSHWLFYFVISQKIYQLIACLFQNISLTISTSQVTTGSQDTQPLQTTTSQANRPIHGTKVSIAIAIHVCGSLVCLISRSMAEKMSNCKAMWPPSITMVVWHKIGQGTSRQERGDGHLTNQVSSSLKVVDLVDDDSVTEPDSSDPVSVFANYALSTNTLWVRTSLPVWWLPKRLIRMCCGLVNGNCKRLRLPHKL